MCNGVIIFALLKSLHASRKMGIEANYVLPVKDHLSVFNCALCSNLVSDGYVTTSCGHCFCRGCFRTWTKTQLSTTAVRRCPKCEVKIASEGNDGAVDWQVQTLIKAQPLVHRMLCQVKVLCPCRSSARTCYWTGDYGDLKEHITTSHEQPTANESRSKSSNTLESTSEHQVSAIGSNAEFGSQPQRTKNKSDHVRKSNKHQKQVPVVEERDNTVPRRMTRRRSLSMSDSRRKSKATASDAYKVSHSRRQSRDEDSADETTGSGNRGTSGLSTERSMGSRLTESNTSSSLRNSEEYQSEKPPPTSMRRYISPSSLETTSTPASSPETALNTDARRHYSGTALAASNDTSESPKRSEWPRRKPLEYTRTSASMPTSLAPEVSTSRSKVNARFLEKQGDGESTSSSRRAEHKKKGVSSLSPIRRSHLDSTTRGSMSLSPLPPKGQRNQHLAKWSQANLSYKEGKHDRTRPIHDCHRRIQLRWFSHRR
ncbi:hypothetical protein MHU86_11838 [Fragilaria crotonensis]|nr:hypothetical protein MHU86_11838 [Fragilaria crotonensis]